MSALRTGSLCTGYGGLDFAVHSVVGGELAWVADIDPGAAAILAHRFPQVPNLGDITAADWPSIEGVDVLTAGFPCFAAGTRILTETGWLPIEDVRVGDLVLTHAGRWRPVTSVMSRVSDHTITVHGQGIPEIATTEEHPFYARTYRHEWRNRQRGGRPRVFSTPEWVGAAKLAGQFIGQVLPPVEDAPGDVDLWWVVGRYLADGWTTTGRRGRNRVVICCAHHEADDLEERIGRVVHATRSEDLTTTKFIVTRAWFVDFVERLGRGAAGKTLTRREMALPTEKADALLTGWLSGDGCRTQGAWKGTTVSRSLALSMALLAQRARGVVASLNETAVPSSVVISGRVVGQRTQYQVVIRDRNRSAITEGDYGWKLVRNATRTEGPTLVHNLSVAEDESYVADGAIVHNCQDVSCAGARAGLREGNRTGVWSHVARAIGELRPSLVVLENVRGLLSAGADSDMEPCPWCLGDSGDESALRALGAVLGDLADIGFDAEWTLVSAAEAGAPHRRERVFIIGWPAADAETADEGRRVGARSRARRQAPVGVEAGHQPRHGGGSPAADTDGAGREGAEPAAGRNVPARGAAADAQGDGRHQGRPEPAGIVGRPDASVRRDGAPADACGGGRGPGEQDLPAGRRDSARGALADAERGGRDGRPRDAGGVQKFGAAAWRDSDAPADTNGDGLARGAERDSEPERGEAGHQQRRVDPLRRVLDWGNYAPAVARWEAATGRAAPRPTEPGRTGERLSPAFVEWMMGLPEGWVTDVPGLSRNAQLKALGNGVVPQQAELALRLLLERASLAESRGAA